MTAYEISNIQRALGRIEGIALGLEDKYEKNLLEAVKVINLIVEAQEGENCEG